MDCGNFVCNGRYVYITDKILEQNENLFPKEIEIILKKATGLQPIFLTGNSSDNIGHTDAYLNFVDNDTALLSSYPTFPFLKDDLSFLKSLEQDLISAGITIKTIHDRPVYESGYCGCSRKGSKPCFYSARGIYTNFLRINNLIILPEYTLSSKKEHDYYNKVNQETLEELGFEVKRINCDKLAKLGGVLHCISFCA